jgi:hypothetical protein
MAPRAVLLNSSTDFNDVLYEAVLLIATLKLFLILALTNVNMADVRAWSVGMTLA